MEEKLKNLNNDQREAVMTTEGYIRVIASPGSGKTSTLVSRYTWLREELGIPASNSLCITFTNKATKEIKERVRVLEGEYYDTQLITTYHGFCIKLLKGNMGYFHFPTTINVLDGEDKKSLLKDIYKELGIKATTNSYKSVIGKISAYKSNNVESTVDFLSNPKESTLEFSGHSKQDMEFHRILEAYLIKQRQTYYLDYDDIIAFAYVLLKRNKAVLKEYQEKIQYILIDEYQDSDRLQIEIGKMLAQKNGNLFVVGDPDQAIYEWRGAFPQYFVDFNKHHIGCKDIFLNKNYRSTKKIVHVSNNLIKNNKVRVDKTMVTDNESGENILFFHGRNDKDEALWIVKEINKLIANGASCDDIAILYRSNYQSRAIEEGLLNQGLNYAIWGGTKFFERKEIKDIISYLKLINSDDNISFKRIINVPKRKMGNKKMEFLENVVEEDGISYYQALKDNSDNKTFKGTNIQQFIDIIEHCRNNNLTPSKSIEYVLKNTGYEAELRADSEEDRLDNLAELIRFTREFEVSDDSIDGTLEEFLEHISLYTDKDEEGFYDSVKLLTMHTSKGLEFENVFICGLTEGVIPSARTVFDRGESGLEEERRLMYVAVTRAKKRLYISDARGFNYDGKERETSRFVDELGLEYIERLGLAKSKENTWSSKNQGFVNTENPPNKIFNAQDLIHHKVWGIGQILSVDKQLKTYTVKFDNKTLQGLRVISMNYTGIEKI